MYASESGEGRVKKGLRDSEGSDRSQKEREEIIDSLQKSINRQIHERQRTWIIDSAVMDLRERLFIAMQKQLLKYSPQKNTCRSIGALNRLNLGSYRELGLECLMSSSARLEKEILEHLRDRRPLNFLAGLCTEDPRAIKCILSGIQETTTLACAFDRLNMSRISGAESSAENKAFMMICCLGELHDAYMILEKSLLNPDCKWKPDEKAVTEATLAWLSETLTMLIHFFIDCSKFVATDEPNELQISRVETLARSIFYGIPHLESVFFRMIREGRAREIRLALELILNKNDFISQEDRLRLLGLLTSIAEPFLARRIPMEKGMPNKSSLDLAMRTYSEAHSCLRTIFEPVIAKLLSESEQDAEFVKKRRGINLMSPSDIFKPFGYSIERSWTGAQSALNNQSERQRCLTVSRILDTKKTVRNLFF